MLVRLVPVLVCAAVFLSLVPSQTCAYAFLQLLNPKKPSPPIVAHLSQYLGVPITDSDTPMRFLHPRMQRFIRDSQNVNDKASAAFVTLTDTGVLGALNPRDGGIAWRRLVDQDDHIRGLFSIDDGTYSLDV